MKKILLFLFIAFSVFSYAQTTIKMEKDGGIYKIQCKVNGAPMKMYFDTGASAVSLSRATAIYLLDNDLISQADFIGKTKTTTAEGAIVDNMVIRLRDIEIGGLHLRNVDAVVSFSLNAPLLLGQTAISKLGKITLNGDILTIHSGSSLSLSVDKREELDRKLKELRTKRFSDKETNFQILDIIKVIEKNDELNEYELYCKVMSESNIGKKDDVISDSEIWIERFALDTDSLDMKMRVFYASAWSNILSENGDKELGMQHLSRCKDYFDNDSTFFWYSIPLLYYYYNEYKNEGFTDAIYYTKLAINKTLKFKNVSVADINNNQYSNVQIGGLLADLSVCFYEQFELKKKQNHNTNWSNNQRLTYNLCIIFAAKLGDSTAKDYCREHDLNYKKKLTQKELDLIGIANVVE